MKKLLIFGMALLCTYVNAHTVTDVLRFSNDNLQGTARFQAMGGAFGALGGDLSAININPAGAAVFNYNEFTATATNFNSDNDAFLGNTRRNTDTNALEFNQVGGVLVFKTSNNSPWRKITIAANYDLVQNFDNQIFASGNSAQGGIDNYFLSFADGQALGPLRVQTSNGERIDDAYLDIGSSIGFGAQQAFLGFQSGIIDPTDDIDENTSYFSNAQYTSLNQTFNRITSGFNSKFTLNLAGQYQENLYIGASLNFHSIFYDELTTIDETGFDPDSEIQSISFDNFLHTEGNGFSFNVGAIAKLNENIRIGGSYQSPTWYFLTDDVSQRIRTDSPVANPNLNLINFNLVNFFPEYRIKTAAKLTGSAAIIFGKDGLLSFDYGYQDMSQAELRPTSDTAFANENEFISEQLGVVNSFNVGGEYRINQVSLRAGYRFEESPYEDETILGDLTGYSGGIGYSFGPNRLDLAYSRTEQETDELFFNSGASNSTLVNRTNTNISLGYTWKF